MIEAKIADHGIQAGHIKAGLKLEGLPREEQEARCRLYRAWRPKSDKKDMLPTYQAYDLAIAGIEPNDVQIRKMEFMACGHKKSSMIKATYGPDFCGECAEKNVV